MSFIKTIVTGTLLTWAIATPAAAQYGGPVPVSDIDPAIFQIDETKFLGKKLISNLPLVDASGKEFTLRQKLDKTTVLVLSYFTCDGSCSIINQDLKAQLEDIKDMAPGRDFNIVTLSFDKNDTTETLNVFKKSLKMTEKMEKGWTFGTFKNPDDIKPFTDNIGFKFFWSPQDKAFFHPGAFMFLTPNEGRLARVLYALSTGSKDIKLAVLDAKGGKFKPSEIVDYAVSLCYSYNYKEGRYTYNIPMFVGAGSLTLGVTSFVVSVLVFRRRRRLKEVDS
ncbi:MAG: SCO family protein [Rhodospirillaceae bacterium]|nr:SCO family protein [Rhodospirillaceae bacterium]